MKINKTNLGGVRNSPLRFGADALGQQEDMWLLQSPNMLTSFANFPYIPRTFHILENINKKVETIDKAVKMIKNANDDIRSEVVKGQGSAKITIKNSTN